MTLQIDLMVLMVRESSISLNRSKDTIFMSKISLALVCLWLQRG